jgi:6-phosphogluconolactonase
MKSQEPHILLSQGSGGWADFAADIIGHEIRSVLSRKNVCHVMLTGGNTVEGLYKKWASLPTFPFPHLSFLIGDERCVPSDDPDSNYNMVMKTLLIKGVPVGCSIARMEAENPDRKAAARAYEKLIPSEIDVLLLGVGADGHIASLFPGSSALLVKDRSVVPVTGSKAPYQRLTITPRVIASAKSVFILATGERKGKVLAEALKPESSFMSLPVCLTLGGTWLLDDEAGRQCLNRDKN